MIVFRASLAALLGAIVALSLYLLWFFQITHHDHPWDGATTRFMLVTGVVAAIVGLLGGYLSAILAPHTPHGAADATAALIAIAAIFADRHTPGQHHWAQLIALLVATPAAYAAGRLRPRRPHAV